VVKITRNRFNLLHENNMTIDQFIQPINDPILHDIVKRLVPVYEPASIYLFGSRARGVQNDNSDYDILIIADDNVAESRKSASAAYEALWGISVTVDVLVWTKQEFQKRLHVPNSLPAKITREGQLLHVA
jgi:predicted nucleotidyltransferase